MVFLLVLLILLCLCLAAFFAGSETAMISANKISLRAMEMKGSRKAFLANRLLEDPERFFGTILVGTNIAVVAGTSMAAFLLKNFLVEEEISPSWSSLLTTAIMTPLILIFGEILPKSIGRGDPERWSLRSALPLHAAYYPLSIIVVATTSLSSIFVRIFSKERGKKNPFVSREEFKLMAEIGEDAGILDGERRRMIHEVFDLEHQPISRVMVPLVDIVAVEEQGSLKDVLQITGKTGFTRIPVYRERVDNIVGIVSSLEILYSGRTRGPISPFLHRDFLYVPETKSVGSLLLELLSQKVPMAVAVDEYGGVVGLVTTEDLIEEVVGEIRDERDQYAESLVVKGKESFQCEARMEMDDLQERLNISISKEGFTTVGGLLLKLAGRIPSEGEEFVLGDYTIKVLEADKRRVKRVEFFRKAKTGEKWEGREKPPSPLS